jgi:hypothetical protein
MAVAGLVGGGGGHHIVLSQYKSSAHVMAAAAIKLGLNMLPLPNMRDLGLDIEEYPNPTIFACSLQVCSNTGKPEPHTMSS